MRKQRFALMTLFVLILVLLTTLAANALPIVVERVEIDDISLSSTATNRLSLERDQVVDVEVQFYSDFDLDDVELEAFFSGFEYNDVEPLGARTHLFDMDAGVSYVKRLQVALSGDAEEDDYQLRVLFTDRFDPSPVLVNFPIKIDVPRHRLDIEDVFFTPSSQVRAGAALIGTVRLENNGEKYQDDVKVTVSIPKLHVSGVDYIDEIEVEDEEETEEIFLRIPQDAASGDYDVHVEIVYDEGHRKITKNFPITIVGDPRFEPTVPGQVRKAGTLVTLGSTLEAAVAGKEHAVFPITVVNHGKNSRTYSIAVEAVEWADIKVTPTSTMIIEGGESKLYTVTVSPNKDAEAGAQIVNVKLTESDKTLKELQLTANVKPGDSSLESLKRGLKIVLIVLLVLLAMIAIGIVVKKMTANDDDEEYVPSPETYY